MPPPFGRGRAAVLRQGRPARGKRAARGRIEAVPVDGTRCTGIGVP